MRMKLALTLVMMGCTFAASANASESGRGFDVRLTGDTALAGEVLKAVRDWEAAYQRNDIDAILSLWDADAEIVVPGLAKALGFKQLEQGYRQEAATAQPGRPVWVGVIDEIFAEGNTAFVLGIAEQESVKADGSIAVGERNRCIDLFRRHKDKSWHVFRSMCYPLK